MADTGSGAVVITIPARLGAQFSIDSGSGRIDVDVPHRARTIERDHLTGTIGDGRGRIQIDTGSGSVRLQRRSASGGRAGSVLGARLIPHMW